MVLDYFQYLHRLVSWLLLIYNANFCLWFVIICYITVTLQPHSSPPPPQKKKKRKKRKIILSLSENYDILMKKVCKKISFNACFLATSKYLFPNPFSIMIFPLCDKIMELSRQLFQGFNGKKCNSILCNAIARDTWDSTPEWNYPCLWGNVCT